MKEKIEQFLTYKASIEDEFKDFCKNTNIPLEDRWSLFLKSDLGTIKCYITSCTAARHILERIDYTDKYATVQYNQLFNWIEDYDDDDQPSNKKSDTEKEIIKIKEYALQNFEKGFKFDW